MAELTLSTVEMKTLLTKKALEAKIPPKIIKAVSQTENGNWQQFTKDGDVFTSTDKGYGIMQVTPLSDSDIRFDEGLGPIGQNPTVSKDFSINFGSI